MKNKLYFIFIFLFPLSCLSYIIQLETILSKLSQNQGKSYYEVKKEVWIKENDTSFSQVKETWYIKDENNMLVFFKGITDPSVQGAFLYKNGFKYYLDQNKKLQKKRLTPRFFEGFFVARSPESLRKYLFQNKILPRSSLFSPAEEENDLVSLTRKLSSIHYLIGKASKESLNPGIWVEQDIFHLRFLRLKNLSEITANKYKNKGSFHYPSSLQIKFKDDHFFVKNKRVNYLKKTNSYFKTKYLYRLKKYLPERFLSEKTDLFYKNFR